MVVWLQCEVGFDGSGVIGVEVVEMMVVAMV